MVAKVVSPRKMRKRAKIFKELIRRILSDSEDTRADWLLINEKQIVDTRRGPVEVDFLVLVREFVTMQTVRKKDPKTGKIRYIVKPVFRDAVYGLIIDDKELRTKWIPVG